MLSRLTVLALLAGLSLGQDVARKEITLDPQTLSRYVGVYQMDANANMLITLENNQLFSKWPSGLRTLRRSSSLTPPRHSPESSFPYRRCRSSSTR